MRITSIISLALILLSFPISAQTDGSVTFTIKTIEKNVGYKPKHVLAIWVSDNNNKLVKNLEVSASERKKYLYTWNTASGGSANDITTGATLKAHISHSKTWNCRDKSGILVADGTYKINTEFTSEHAQGPINVVSFTKGANAITINPAASTYFSNINLVFAPLKATGIEPDYQEDYEMDVYPNPAQDYFKITYTLKASSSVNLSIYNMNMQLVKVIHEKKGLVGFNELQWTISPDIKNGSYVLVLQSDRFIATRKIVIMK